MKQETKRTFTGVTIFCLILWVLTLLGCWMRSYGLVMCAHPLVPFLGLMIYGSIRSFLVSKRSDRWYRTPLLIALGGAVSDGLSIITVLLLWPERMPSFLQLLWSLLIIAVLPGVTSLFIAYVRIFTPDDPKSFLGLLSSRQKGETVPRETWKKVLWTDHGKFTRVVLCISAVLLLLGFSVNSTVPRMSGQMRETFRPLFSVIGLLYGITAVVLVPGMMCQVGYRNAKKGVPLHLCTVFSTMLGAPVSLYLLALGAALCLNEDISLGETALFFCVMIAVTTYLTAWGGKTGNEKIVKGIALGIVIVLLGFWTYGCIHMTFFDWPSQFYAWDDRSLEKLSMWLIDAGSVVFNLPLLLLALRGFVRLFKGKHWLSLTERVPYRLTQAFVGGTGVLLCWELWRLWESFSAKQLGFDYWQEAIEQVISVWMIQHAKTGLLLTYWLYGAVLLVKQYRRRKMSAEAVK